MAFLCIWCWYMKVMYLNLGLIRNLACAILAIFFYATYVVTRKAWTRFEPWPLRCRCSAVWSLNCVILETEFFRPSSLLPGGGRVPSRFFLKCPVAAFFFVLHVSVGNWIEIMVCLCRILIIFSFISNFSFLAVNGSTVRNVSVLPCASWVTVP